jgi:hypothetical protein
VHKVYLEAVSKPFLMIVIVIFGLMVRMVVAVVMAGRVIVVVLIPGMAVHKSVAVFVQVFVKMVVLDLSMPMLMGMQVSV